MILDERSLAVEDLDTTEIIIAANNGLRVDLGALDARARIVYTRTHELIVPSSKRATRRECTLTRIVGRATLASAKRRAVIGVTEFEVGFADGGSGSSALAGPDSKLAARAAACDRALTLRQRLRR